MTDQDRVRDFLDGLADLSRETGIGLCFGGPGNEARLSMVDRRGNELFQVERLAPSSNSELEPVYELVFTGTLRFSSRSSGSSGPTVGQEKLEADEREVERTRIGASVVRVERRFTNVRVEETENLAALEGPVARSG